MQVKTISGAVRNPYMCSEFGTASSYPLLVREPVQSGQIWHNHSVGWKSFGWATCSKKHWQERVCMNTKLRKMHYKITIYWIQKLSLAITINALPNPEIQSRINKGCPIIPILSRISPVTSINTYLFKIHQNIILHLSLGLPGSLFPVSWPAKLFSSTLVTCLVPLNLVDLSMQTILG